MKLWIETKIPYEPGHRLADAYNRAMRESSAPWVLLLDHDVYLACNPHWYEISLEVVGSFHNDVGMVTCKMNGCKNRPQDPMIPITKETDLAVHEGIAHNLFKRWGSSLMEVKTNLVAGYFMLVNRQIWKEIPFSPRNGRYKVDQTFAGDLLKNDYKIYVMNGLYVYHRRGGRKINWR